MPRIKNAWYRQYYHCFYCYKMESLTFFLWSVLLLLLIDKQNITKQNLAHLIHCGPCLHFYVNKIFHFYPLHSSLFLPNICLIDIDVWKLKKSSTQSMFFHFFVNNLTTCLFVYKWLGTNSKLDSPTFPYRNNCE